MESVLIAAMLAASPLAAPSENAGALDQRCFRLMAELAEDDDSRLSALGRVAAQYFLGRIDATAPGFDPTAALEGAGSSESERTSLLGRCGEAMQAGGLDFRSIAQTLAPRRRPTA